MDNLTIKEIEILLVSIKFQYALLKKPTNSGPEFALLNSYDKIITKLTAQKSDSISDLWRVSNNNT